MPVSQYTVPSAASDPQTRLGWLREAVQSSQASLENVPGFDNLERNLSLIQSDSGLLLPGAFSQASIRSGKSAISDVVSTLTNMRPLWQYTNQNKKYAEQADVLNKCSWAWWYNTYADQQISLAVQYSAVQYIGWLQTGWNPNFHAPGIGDIEIKARGPQDVLLLFPDRTFDAQKAYAVIIIEEMPLVEAWATWPEYKDQLKPTSENASWWRRKFSSAWNSRPFSFFHSAEDDSFPKSFPTITVYQMYVRDTTKNTSGRDVEMGLPGSSWNYTVPSLGSEMPTGVFGSAGEKTKRADDVDSLLYPFRRQITFTDTCIMYDNTSRWMHGKAPVVKFQLDPWPFDYFGGCMADDIRTVEGARNQLVRDFNDSSRLTLDPPKEVNAQQYSDTEIKGMTLRKPGATYENENFQLGPSVRAILSGNDYGLHPQILEFVKYLDQQRDDLCARVDFNALAKSRSSGMSGDSMEKLLQLAGPRTTAKSRNLERSMKELGQQNKGYFLQFYDIARRMTLFGFRGVARTDWDYDFGTLVPDEIQGLDGQTYSSQSSRYDTRAKRARMFQFLFSEEIEPGSLHDITNMTRQLSLLTLQKIGFPIDYWTIAQAYNFNNFGPKPDGVPDNMLSLWLWQTEKGAEFQAMVAAKQQQIMMAASPQAQMMGALGQMTGAAAQAQGGQEGRPNVFTAPPTQMVKPDENGVPRTTIATSETSM